MRWYRFIFSFFIATFCFLSALSHADDLPVSIETNQQLENLVNQLSEQNGQLAEELSNQKNRLVLIRDEQDTIINQIKYVQNTLSTLDEQGEWLNFSTALGDTLRQQLLRLPEKPKHQALDAIIAEIKVLQISYNTDLDSLKSYPTASGNNFDKNLSVKYQKLLKEKKELLHSLITGSDSLIVEFTRLKIENKQLTKAIDDVNDAAHKYFFWVADINPITIDYPLVLAKDMAFVIFSIDTLSQLYHASINAIKTPQTLFLLFFAFILIIIHIKMQNNYQHYLQKIASKVGKVTQDSFSITIRIVVFSLFMALPIPVLWGIVGYALQTNWDYPVAVAFGYGINSAAPILWVFSIAAHFASPNGLFIAHFRWPAEKVRSAMKYYRLSVWVIIPLVMILMSLDQYNNHQFAATVGRFSFILLCFCLVFMTNSIHNARVPLYIDRKASGDNVFSKILWLILRTAPWIAILAACLGYLSTAQILLGRLEASVVIWLALLIIYSMIRRWMWIQKRRIEFEREKQKRFERFVQRSKTEDENSNNNFSNPNDNFEEPDIDLDVISAQSLQLVRSIIVMISLICMILLWSELHSAFAFMDNIKLWVTKSSVHGVETEQYITLSSVFIAILVMTITIQLVKNLPALLELGILQHLDLAPGTGYAISTVTKYMILIIGSIIAFSFIGIDWAKIQWLIAALGVGLGFGLQEIFANFISGLIMLFEKPVRIGDTVTIRDLTGTISKINTRATTIIDWDRKEIVMPNKAFVTEQLVNWSLSDTVTRIVLTIPATIDANSETIIEILKKGAKECEYVLDDPEPQIFLVDIQEGIQLYEVRLFAKEMADRMPLRSDIHKLIIQEYRKHDLELPFPPLQTNFEATGRKSGRRIYTSGSL